MFWIVMLLVFVILSLAFAAIGIKMFLKKDGKFERRCENEGSTLCACGGKGGTACQHCPNEAKA